MDGKNSSMYYLLSGKAMAKRWIGWYPQFDDIWWTDGERFPETAVKEPLEYTLKPIKKGAWDHGPYMPSFFDAIEMPLFRDDLVAVMNEAGVDNIDFYDANITDDESGEVFTNYKAVNIIGLIAAADLKKSKSTIHNDIPLVDVEFEELVIDESRIFGIPIFRLAENNSIILVSDKLKQCIEAKGINDLEFHELAQAAIL